MKLGSIEGVEQVTIQAAPTGSHQSIGAAERAHQTLRGLARVYLVQLETKTGVKLDNQSPWWSWALKHAAWVYNRYHKRADTGYTPYEKYRHCRYGQTLLPFGERVFAKRATASKADWSRLFGSGVTRSLTSMWWRWPTACSARAR